MIREKMEQQEDRMEDLENQVEDNERKMEEVNQRIGAIEQAISNLSEDQEVAESIEQNREQACLLYTSPSPRD